MPALIFPLAAVREIGETSSRAAPAMYIGEASTPGELSSNY